MVSKRLKLFVIAHTGLYKTEQLKMYIREKNKVTNIEDMNTLRCIHVSLVCGKLVVQLFRDVPLRMNFLYRVGLL